MTPDATIPYVAAEADSRIEIHLPPDAQTRALARRLELAQKQNVAILTHLGLPADYGLTDTEKVEIARIEAIWAWAREVRTLEASISDRIQAGETIDRTAIPWPAFPV